METTRIIEQYFDGTLSEEEKHAVESRIHLDKEFRELIRLHKDVNESIRDNDLHLLRDRIGDIGRDYLDNPDSASQKRWKKQNRISYANVFRIAAVFILVVAAGVVLKLTVFSHTSAEGLYTKFYNAYDADMVLRSPQDEEKALDKAIRQYDLGNYSEALALLDESMLNHPGDYLALFYRGLVCLETGDTPRAIQSFIAIPGDWNSPFNEHLHWYLALAHLKNNSKPAAEEILGQISSGGGFYAERAKLILKKL